MCVWCVRESECVFVFVCVCGGGGGQRETDNERAEIFNHIRQSHREELKKAMITKAGK